MNRTRILMTGLAVASSLTLTGCINVLPKTKPVQLYRFGYDAATLGKDAIAPATAGATTPVNLGLLDFPQVASSDRVTTTEGNEISYIAGSRWAAPARQLFQEAVMEGFARSATTVRLDPRGPASAFRLDIGVRHFESVYKHGKPTVSVELDASLVRLSDRVVVGRRFISADVAVKRSDMSMMAESYNEATSKAVAALVDFTQETVAANPLPDAKVALPAK